MSNSKEISPSTSLTNTGNGSNNNLNYKTLLCHQWLTNGTCPRGSSCNYAHGTAEIRPRTGELPESLYKREMCKFWMSGKCAHGDTCNYAHGQSEIRAPYHPATREQQQPIPAKTVDVHPYLPYGFTPPPFPQQNMANLQPFGTPYLVSNPPPPLPPAYPSLWGQPPPRTTPPLLNSLLKPNHFQPLTGMQQPMPPVLPPVPSPLFTQQQQNTAVPVSLLPQQPQPPSQPLRQGNFLLSSPAPMTMAEVAMQFEAMNLQKSIETQQPLNFNAIDDDIDFPSLDSTNKVCNEKKQQEQAKKSVEPKSFAKIAAKTPAILKAAVKEQQLSALRQPQPMAPATIVNKVITRPNKQIIEHQIANEEIVSQSAPTTPFLPQLSVSSSSPPVQMHTSMSTESDNISVNDDIAPALMESHLEDLWNQDPYLIHCKNTEEEMIKSIERENAKELEDQQASDEWQTVSRRRKSSLNAEHLLHRPSPCTDDGYQEDYSEVDEEAQLEGHVASTERTADSPASSIARRSDADGQGSHGNHLDNQHIFYRTHICHFWQAWIDKKGPKCRHGETCFYAHGEKKLIKLNPAYYKTVLCEQFNRDGDCHYGANCNFAHGEKDLRKPGTFKCANGKDKKFFSVAKRYQLRKQRGTQTIQCIPTAAKHFDKVTVIKPGEGSSHNKK